MVGFLSGLRVFWGSSGRFHNVWDCERFNEVPGMRAQDRTSLRNVFMLLSVCHLSVFFRFLLGILWRHTRQGSSTEFNTGHPWCNFNLQSWWQSDIYWIWHSFLLKRLREKPHLHRQPGWMVTPSTWFSFASLLPCWHFDQHGAMDAGKQDSET